MSAVFSLEDLRSRDALAGACCAFGVFDGVHAGHRFLIQAACDEARLNGCKAVILTFDIDPDERFHPQRLKKLLSNRDRIRMLSQLGADAVVVIPFTEDFAALSPQDFLQAAFGGNVPASLHVGADIRFGAKAAGDVSVLREWGADSGMRVFACDLVRSQGEPVTATRVRLLLAEGDVETARELLTYPYTLCDKVVPGRGEGRDMGFRTANLVVEPARRVLREGVYAAYAVVEGCRYKAAVSVGVSPMFQERTKAYSEVHILDFAGDIYDQEIEVQFIAWLRPMMKFPTVEELISTVMADIGWVRDNL